MILKVLFIQRKCSYDGEFAPEAMVCVDEFCFNENPKWFENEVENYLEEQADGISSHAVVDIEIDHKKLSSILNNNPTIKGEIK